MAHILINFENTAETNICLLYVIGMNGTKPKEPARKTVTKKSANTNTEAQKLKTISKSHTVTPISKTTELGKGMI